MNTPGSERQEKPRVASVPGADATRRSDRPAERLRVYDDQRSTLGGAADEFVRRATVALAERGRFVTLLCPGGCSRALYRSIAERAGALRGASLCLVIGEEQRVDPGDPSSCFRAAWEELAEPLELAAGQVWRFFSEGPDPAFVTEWFQELLQRALGRDLVFDLVVVGLGPDGRLGALPTPVAAPAAGVWAACAGDGTGAAGFSATPAMLSRSRCTMFLGLGDETAEAVRLALDGTTATPAGRVASAETLWFADRAAARRPLSPAGSACAGLEVPETPSATATRAAAPAKGLTEEELVLGLRRGDARAYEALVRDQAARMLATARRMVRDPDEARDVVQEAFLSAWRHRERFKGNSLVSTWLHRITVNAALMRLRRRAPHVEQPLEDLLPRFGGDGHMVDPAVAWRNEGDTELELRERRLLVRRCIDDLPESYRVVLLLRDIEEVGVQDAAELLGISANAVNIRLHRARQALRSMLDPHLRGTVP